jgi:hypothetical protein
MPKKHLLILLLINIFLSGIYNNTNAQQLTLPLNTDYNLSLQKEIYSPEIRFHTSIRPYVYSEVNNIINIDSLNNNRRLDIKSPVVWKKKVWESLFNKDVVRLTGKNYAIAINPLLQFELGKDFTSDNNTLINTRGIEVKGTLGERFSFYTNFRENQAVFSPYVTNFIRSNSVVPGQGMYKGFGDAGFDYAYSTAYISYKAGDCFNIQFGHGRNFIGDGYRSLLLADNAFPYPYLKLSGEVWHLKYMAQYAQLIDIRSRKSYASGFARKYTTSHYLSWAVTERFNISVFDAIIWQTEDSAGNYRGFDIQYLNPIIFLRPVEFSVGSPDNAMMGMTMGYKVGKHTILYGQLALDEFKISEIRSGNGWWANKQAFQLGIKSFDAFGIKNLYLQTEYNWVRPYMYTHMEVKQNYGHYNQSLAHPWGANFWESVSFIKYNYNRWHLHYELQYGLFGDDLNGLNYGHDIYRDYNTHVQDYGNKVGQGLKTTVLLNDITISWLINPAYNLNVYAGVTQRHIQSDERNDKEFQLHFGLRTSLENMYIDF